MSALNCPECCENLEVIEDDLRNEWERIEYYCNTCEKSFYRHISFKLQSSLVEFDTLEDEDGNEV